MDDPRIADVTTLRALAHPLRWDLLEVLTAEGGTATASRCAALLGQSQATCSFHLRQLARFGMVEEAPSASKRERPWRLRSSRQSWSNEPTGDPGRDDAAQALSAVFIDRETERIRRWARTSAEAPDQWRGAAAMSAVLTWLTAAELEQFGAELAELLQKHADRIEHPERRPADSRPVRLFGVGFPLLELAADGSE